MNLLIIKLLSLKRVVCFILLLSSISALCQKVNLQVIKQEKIIGKDFITDSDITGTELVFPDRIHDFFVDNHAKLLTIQLRGWSYNQKSLLNRGTLLQYDIINNKILWDKRFFYNRNYLQQYGNSLILIDGLKSYCLDVYTGKDLWQTKHNIYIYNPANHIGIGYKYSSTNANKLIGIDFQNGNVLWNRELSREYGWNEWFFRNDSILMVAAAGLHSINIKTGEGWQYNTITGKKDYTSTAVANSVGVALGLLTGSFVISTGYDLVRDLVSNIIVDSVFIYFASLEQLVKIDKNSGEIVWKYPFPKDIVSKSTIFVEDSAIYMINNGMSFMGNRQIKFGKPFIAAFDIQTGVQKYFYFTDIKKDYILDFYFADSDFYLLFTNKIEKYCKKTGEKILENLLSEDDFGFLKYFANEEKIFITSQTGNLVSLAQNDSTKIYIFTNRDKIISIDNELTAIDIIDFKDVGVSNFNKNDFYFIVRDDKTFIINKLGEVVVELFTTSWLFTKENILYFVKDDSFITVDLNSIINF